ncbi:MAG: S1 RNA-binding domain-containing protein [Deltaproteobacteria bacterium]|nr:S1 RNA-binding domain-containing protein [Deltaproteobacteria bacterium]
MSEENATNQTSEVETPTNVVTDVEPSTAGEALAESTPSGAAAAEAPVDVAAAQEEASAAYIGAVDTGRRIDPSKLAAKPRTRVRRKNDSDGDKPNAKAPRADKSRADKSRADKSRADKSRAPKNQPNQAAPAHAAAAHAAAAHAAAEHAPASSEGAGKQKAAPQAAQDRKRQKSKGRRDQKPKDETDGRYMDKNPSYGDDRPKDPTKISALPPESREVLNTFDASGDFAAMLEEAGPIQMVNVGLGEAVQAKIIRIAGEHTFCDIGGGQEAWMHTSEILDPDGEHTATEGDTLRAFVVANKDGKQISKKLGRHGIDVGMLEEAQRNQIPIEGKVTGFNKGGLEVEIGGGRGFCPLGQADINFVEDVKSFVDQTFFFLVKEVKENGKNVLLSRRALLEKERNEKREALMATLEVGSVVEGVVTRIQPFGVFVELGGEDGMIPISELSWGHVKDANDVVSEGQTVKVEVTRIEPNPKRSGEWRIGLSRKAVEQDPWDEHVGTLQIGSNVPGKVTRLADFGAFVEIFPGVEGLIHISELSPQRIMHPSEVVKEDESVSVRILEINLESKRIGLSLREAKGIDDDKGEGGKPKAALSRGVRLKGTVNRIENYGVFLALTTGDNALLPASETGTQRGTDLRRAFPLETELDVMVIEVDDRGRIRVSITALAAADERAEIADYNKSQGQSASLGTFGDLLQGFKL